MTSAHSDSTATNDRYEALLAVSAAIVAHRDLCALFHDLAGRLRQVVRFDYLTLVLHDAATNTMHMHVLEPPEPTEPAIVLPPEEDPAGLVWQTQQPLVTSSLAELKRWPRLLERVQSYGVQSYCWLPLTTARRRLGHVPGRRRRDQRGGAHMSETTGEVRGVCPPAFKAIRDAFLG